MMRCWFGHSFGDPTLILLARAWLTPSPTATRDQEIFRVICRRCKTALTWDEYQRARR